MSAFEPSDGIAETVERQLQVAVAGVTISARAIAARRHQALREAQATSEDAARALRARQHQERALAAARIAPVFENAWWETASPHDVASMWQEAATWSTHPDDGAVGPAPTIFDHAVGRIGREVHERSGLDIADLAMLAELQQLEHEHHEATQASESAAAEWPSEPSEEPTLATVATAGGAPVSAERPARGFDGPERRERLRERLTNAGVPEDAIHARVLADIGQGRKPEQATRNAGQPTPPAQSAPARQVAEQRRRHR